jgi:hypothetical protein
MMRRGLLLVRNPTRKKAPARQKNDFDAVAATLGQQADELQKPRRSRPADSADTMRAMALVLEVLGRADEASRRYAKWMMLLTILSVVLVAGSVVLVAVQLRESERAVAITNDIGLSSLLFGNAANDQIIERLEQAQPVLKDHGGPISGAQLDNFLGTFDTIEDAYGDGQLTEPILCVSFSYFVVLVSGNAEIQAYIRDQRKEDDNYFRGLDELRSSVDRSKESNCRPAPQRPPPPIAKPLPIAGKARPG